MENKMRLLLSLAIPALLMLEKTIKKNADPDLLSYHLLIMLSIHSLIAGTALGVDSSQAGFWVIFFAIIAHKASAAFALTVNFQKNNFRQDKIFRLIVLFSLMTPIGIVFGNSYHQFFTNSGQLFEAIFDAIAAGTFLYMACFHYYNQQAHSALCGHLDLCYFSLGIGLMGLIAIWL